MKAFETIQAKEKAPVDSYQTGASIQCKGYQAKTNYTRPVQLKRNNTGLPDNLKAGVENLSGYSMDDVQVHYNSDKPQQLQALAYAQGTDIHLAPGQEKHLPHEAWHVAQQKQGRVKATMQLKGKIAVNDDAGLEHEADVIGARLLSNTEGKGGDERKFGGGVSTAHAVQLVSKSGKENLMLTVQRRIVPNAALADTYFVEGENWVEEGPYTLLPGSDASHDVVGMTPGGGYRLYYDNKSGKYVSPQDFQLFQSIMTAYQSDEAIVYDMYAMGQAMVEPDARAMVVWLATQPSDVRRFAYANRATLDLPEAKKVVLTWHRFRALFSTAASAEAILSTSLINYDSAALKRLIDTNKFATYADLATVTGSPKFINFANLEQVVTHAKVDTGARLSGWINNAKVDTGTRLYTVLQNPKIHTAGELNQLLTHYNLAQIIQWLAKPWVTHPTPGALTKVDGKVPLAVANAVGNGATAGQRYTPDQPSHASPGMVYHLSMSFSIEGTPAERIARYTGLHVSFRANGAPDRPSDPRVWFSVNNGSVAQTGTSGAFGAAAAEMQAEAVALVKQKLVSINCYM